MILYRARGGSLEADMVFIIIIECIDVPERMILTERERLFATAALNSSGLPIMSSNKEHL
jgi:hypothetical protein